MIIKKTTLVNIIYLKTNNDNDNNTIYFNMHSCCSMICGDKKLLHCAS